MNKLYLVLACLIFTQHAFSQTDCSELLTLSSTPASCNENGTITATFDGCSPSTSGSEVMMALYNSFNNPSGIECIDFPPMDNDVCYNLAMIIQNNLLEYNISFEELIDELELALFENNTSSGSYVFEALYESFYIDSYGYGCVQGTTYQCYEFLNDLQIHLDYFGISSSELINELQNLAEGPESNCTIFWTDEAGNNIGEEFTISDINYGIYTATLTNYDGCVGIQEIEVDFVCAGCMDEEACNFLNTANVEDGSCIYIAEGECDCEGNVNDAIGLCGGNCISDYNENGICDIDDIIGCTYENALNYESIATIDNGSCVFEECPECNDDFPGDIDGDYVGSTYDLIGCTYENALNYEPTATIDNGSCVFEECPEYSDDCPGDLDGDYVVSTSDLLIFLSQFGAVCDNMGCEDADGDGVCDDEDNCPFVANEDQADVNANGIGDACDGCLNDQDCDDGDPNTNEYCENGVCISCWDTNQNNICDDEE